MRSPPTEETAHSWKVVSSAVFSFYFRFMELWGTLELLSMAGFFWLVNVAWCTNLTINTQVQSAVEKWKRDNLNKAGYTKSSNYVIRIRFILLRKCWFGLYDMVKLLFSAVIPTRENLRWSWFQAVSCLQNDRDQHSDSVHTQRFQKTRLACVHRQQRAQQWPQLHLKHANIRLIPTLPCFLGPRFPRSCSVAVDQTHSASLPAQLRFQMSASNTEQRQTTRMDSSPLHFINRLNILESSAALFSDEKRQTLNQERVTFSCLFQSCFRTVNPHTHIRVYEWNYSSSTPC